MKAELRVREKWRFIVSNEAVLNPNGGGPPEVFEDVDDDVFKGSFAAAGVGARTEYGKQLQNKADGGSILGANSSQLHRLKGPVEDSSSTLLEVHAIPEVSSRWTNPTRWKLLASGAWRDVEEHNVKEARVALMSLRRLGRSVTNMGTTCLTLCDNLCSVLMFEKGRSGVFALNNLCERAAAYQIGCSIEWRLRHVRSEDNVADAPSRRWGPDFERPLKSRRLDRNSLGEHFFIDSFEQGSIPSKPSKLKKAENHKVGESQGRTHSVFRIFCGHSTVE